ncbi:hypothetical protein BDN70DRAFT_877522 [Pholiota conissans]|uniref:Sulfhydryl oxidase n=1 Tax=Pholiota conissans TaxID=109636 RepID=A0A9P5Z3M9_9AGAR|nr:hypothetical protein BDN70DRAFT_877522 [Pholiota conissans]
MANETTATPPPQNKSTSGALPPGMVLGPDGKPCKICTAFRNWSPAKTNTQHDPNRPAQTWPTPRSNTGAAAHTPQTGTFAGFSALAGATAATAPHPSNKTVSHDAPSYRANEPPPGCPPDVEQLGRATWTFLHTTAAYYPEKPTPTQRANMIMLLGSLPVLYPCGWCAKDFGENMAKTKPDVSSRVALSRWLCDRHNEVNEKLGKDKFNCAKVDERWKDGPPDGSCD